MREERHIKLKKLTTPRPSRTRLTLRSCDSALAYSGRVEMLDAGIKPAVCPSSGKKNIKKGGKCEEVSVNSSMEKLSIVKAPYSRNHGNRNCDDDNVAKSFSKTYSLRRRRSIIRVPSLKSKKLFKDTGAGDSRGRDFRVNKATCSSILKNSKYPKSSQGILEGDESYRTLPIRMCTYTHCSLHNGLVNSPSHINPPTKSKQKPKSPSIFLDLSSEIVDSVESSSSPASCGAWQRLTLTSEVKNQDIHTASETMQDNHYLDYESSAATPVPGTLKEELHDCCSIFAADKGETPSTKSDHMQLKKDKYVRMWQCLYQNAKACIEKEDKASSITSTSSLDYQENESDQSEELSQTDAVILVKEAIDAICPPNPESLLDSHSVVNHTKSIPDLSLTSCVERDDQDVPRNNWKKLKRIILLKKFIKEIDNRTKSNAHEGRFVWVNTDSEAQKVNLRPHVIGERKHAQHWMLDHALQQVIAELTPGRKEKVQLLIEAFERVNQNQTV